MKKKKKLIIVLVVGVLIVFYLIFAGRNGSDFETFQVVRNDIVSEIFESGVARRGEEINLAFIVGGKVDEIYVGEGNRVQRGDNLAKLEDNDLIIQRNRALAGLASVEASYNSLVSGAREEDITLVKNSLANAKNDLESAVANLERTETVVKRRVENIHKESLSALNTARLAADSAYDTVNDVSKIYFFGVSTENTKKALSMRDRIQKSAKEIKESRASALSGDSYEEINVYLNIAYDNLKIVFNSLESFLDVFDEPGYTTALATDIAAVVAEKSTVNLSISTMGTLIGTASLTNSTNEMELNTARDLVSSTRANVDRFSVELRKIESFAEENDIKKAEALVNQARAEVNLVERSIENSVLKSPVDGTISRVAIREGEIAQVGVPIFTVIPEAEFFVELDIYEGDIPKIKTGNSVSASFLAFQNREFSGEVIFINPIGKLIDGVVYYSIKVILEEYPEEIMPEMTVDVNIRTGERENVLVVPERMISRREGKSFVKVLENGNIVEKEVETGLRGEGRMIEIVSGLEENEKILVE